jgi:Domain of unknown function DUF11/PASTA domain
VTLGSSAMPAGSTPNPCGPGVVLGQATSDPSTPYAAPAGGGAITSWSTNTSGSTAGASVTFLVLRPAGSGNYTVVGVDTETLPTPLPASGVASFPLAQPIAAREGDTLGLYTNSSAATCFFHGGATPVAATLTALAEPAAPAAGQTLSPAIGNSPAGYTMDVAATLETEQDAAVTTSAAPANATAGSFAVLSSTVTNAGPSSGPITFSDAVPAGLTINSVVAGSGSCSTTGQQVTCTISGLAPGQSAPVIVVVTPTAAKSYANTVSIAVANDHNAANNTASATLTVSAARPAPKCVVPSLKRTPLSTAKRVLKLLGCKVGKTRKAHSTSVHKGLVVKTSPKAGTYPAGKTVRLTVSSGPRKKKKHS